MGLSGSVSLSPNIALTGGASNTGYDTMSEQGLDFDFDITELNLGINAHTPISPGTDLIGSLSIVRATINLKATDGITNVSVSHKNTGNILSIGIRSLVTEYIELGGAIGRISFDSGSETALLVNGPFHLNNILSLGIGFQTSDAADITLAALRANF